MASPFAITPSTGSVRLDSKGCGEVTFTVTNTSVRPLRGRAKVVAQDPSQQSWFRLEGEPERNFPNAKSTDQIVVRIAAPPNAAPGKTPFRVDMFSVENPQEVFTVGPTVVCELGPRDVVVKNGGPRWWIIAAALAGLAVIGVGIYFLTRPGKAPAPAPAPPPGPVTMTVTVPGSADPWLAGAPGGATASCDPGTDPNRRCDTLLTEAPVLVRGIPLTADTTLTFTARGRAAHGPTPDLQSGPDGRPVAPAQHGAENGVPEFSAPLNALIGVFVGPGSKRIFLIGSARTVTVPADVTQLYLGTMDGFGWWNNTGSFQVTIRAEPKI